MKIGLEIGDNLLEAIKYIADVAYRDDKDIGQALQEGLGIDFPTVSEHYINTVKKLEMKDMEMKDVTK